MNVAPINLTTNHRKNKQAFGSNLTPETQEYLIEHASEVGKKAKSVIKNLRGDGLNTLNIDLGTHGFYSFWVTDRRFPDVHRVIESCRTERGTRYFGSLNDAFKSLSLFNLKKMQNELKMEQLEKNKEAFRMKVVNRLSYGDFIAQSEDSDSDLKYLSRGAIAKLHQLSKNKELRAKCAIGFNYFNGRVRLYSKTNPGVSELVFNANNIASGQCSSFICALTPEKINTYLESAISRHNEQQRLAQNAQGSVKNLFQQKIKK